MDYKEYARRRLTKDERLAVMLVDTLSRSLDGAAERLKGRLSGYKFLRRDLGTYRSICHRIVKEALTDASADSAEMILRQSRDYQMDVRQVGPVRKALDCVMPVEDEWQFVHIVLDSRCGICIKSPGECNQCGVRKLLRKYTDEPDPGMLGCGYKGHDLKDASKGNKQERL